MSKASFARALLTVFIIPRGDGISKPYVANGISELKQLTVRTHSRGLSYLLLYHSPHVVSSCPCPSGGASQILKHFNGLISLRWERASRNWDLLSLGRW